MCSHKLRTTVPLCCAAALAACLFLWPWYGGAQDTAPGAASSENSPALAAPDSGQATIPAPLPKGKKLILKDGTDQIVREYERDGDRVRYYSVERSAWEEIPASLVDWDATAKAEADEQAQQKELDDKLKAADAAARFINLDVDASLQVRPGVFLPDGAGLYVLDGPAVVPLQQDAASSRVDKGREAEKILSGIPVISSKHTIELPGKQAKLRVHTLDPEFYFRTADGREPEIHLVRADVKGDTRELITVTTNVVGENSYKANEFSLREWDAARSVYRYTLDQSLTAGEYAFIETTKDGPALEVWDFGLEGTASGSSPAAGAKSSGKPKSK